MTTPFLGPVQEYWIDAFQRSVLFLDTLRQRGNRYLEQSEKDVPHVLEFQAELIRDGRNMPRPTNYVLVRIIPSEGTTIDPAKPPFVVVDPRAGHGPGIGGMKHDSEIGAALAAGHTCYFIGFLPEPVPGQTVEDVCLTEAAFIEEVIARHPQAESKPVIIANCQAGWQIMMMAALRPDLTGPIMLAGSPLAYWAGERGKNPLRYLGGMLGGTWLTALAGDVGAGIFDGAHLIANFESLAPSNTYWKKAYNLYSKIDTEAPRYLDFETWWGSPVLLNAGEMQWIADNLFVGNRLSSGGLRASDGTRIDLRNVTSPIIVFCSWGDDITPPQQALGWVTDLYKDEKEIAAAGQTIVYTLHDSVGHLGIFVSGKVATKEHSEFASCMGLIDLLPPGLYEAVITEVDEDTENPELIEGKYLFRLEPRTIDDIRALGHNPPEDERRFATVARVSEVNRNLYRTFASPLLRMVFQEPVAKLLRQLHPHRLRFSVLSDRNPLLWLVSTLASGVRSARRPVSAENPLLSLEKAVSSWIVFNLEAAGAIRDAATEAIFLGLYGNPVLQGLVGVGPETRSDRRIERDLVREGHEARERAELARRFEVGGVTEAAIRAQVHVIGSDGSADERGFSTFAAIRKTRSPEDRRSLPELKRILREQYFLLSLDEERALTTLPALLPKSPERRREALDLVHRMVSARGTPSDEARQRLRRIESLFEVRIGKQAVGQPLASA